MRLFLLISFSLLIPGVVGWAIFIHSEDAPEMTQRVYVWQRIQDSTEVVTAIGSIPENEISGLMPLVAEVHFRNGPDGDPEVILPTLARKNLHQRSAEGCHDAAVFRIGTSAKDTGWNEPACRVIEKLIRETLQSANWSPAEVQLDYDCPQKRLGDYAKLLRHLRAKFPDKKITFTALPSWLPEPEFRTVAEIADWYILQVHSLQIPEDPADDVVLIDPEAAQKAVEDAAEIGRTFEVALPTYSCFVIFSPDGTKVEDVVSEDVPEQWPLSAGKIRLGRTSPEKMAKLVQSWRGSRPKHMRGIVWYRLPVDSDEMNWSMGVWRTVIRGEIPEAQLDVEIKASASQAGKRSELILKNTGDTAMKLPSVIGLQISGNGSYRFDGGRVYEGSGDPLKFTLLKNNADPMPLPSGESLGIGWIDGDVEVVPLPLQKTTILTTAPSL